MQSSIYAELEVKYDSKMIVLCAVKSLICDVLLDALFRNAVAPRCGHSAGVGLWRWQTTSHPNVGPPFCHITPQSFWEPHKVRFWAVRVVLCASLFFLSYVFFLPGEFCQYPGARLTLNSCWVVLRTTGSYAGIQTLERYRMSSAASWLFLSYLSLFTWHDDKAMDPHR